MPVLTGQESNPRTSSCLPVACREVFLLRAKGCSTHDRAYSYPSGYENSRVLVQALDITGDGTNFPIGHARRHDLHHF